LHYKVRNVKKIVIVQTHTEYAAFGPGDADMTITVTAAEVEKRVRATPGRSEDTGEAVARGVLRGNISEPEPVNGSPARHRSAQRRLAPDVHHRVPAGNAGPGDESMGVGRPPG
jgi:hypothetical protein